VNSDGELASGLAGGVEIRASEAQPRVDATLGRYKLRNLHIFKGPCCRIVPECFLETRQHEVNAAINGVQFGVKFGVYYCRCFRTRGDDVGLRGFVAKCWSWVCAEK
jgi:hypothetical protein